jgi:maltose O-acetyltransferase
MRTVRAVYDGLWRDVVLSGLLATPLVPRVARWWLLRACGLSLERSSIAPHVWFGGSRVTMGRGCFVSYRCLFDTSAPITLGPRVNVGMDVSFITSSHLIGPPGRRAGDVTAAPIEVGEGTWIGARVTVLPGVTIGPGCVVAAGAVVVADLPAHGVYAGVPAKRLRSLDTDSGSDSDETIAAGGLSAST